MVRLILISAALAFFASQAQAENRSSSPLVGGEDLPVEAVTQLVADGPVVAIPVQKSADIANTQDSGVEPCLRRGEGMCTATVEKTKRD
jgi:hypothetical protein